MIPFYLLFITFVIADVWCYKKLKGRVSLFMFLLYTVSSLFSVMYVNSDYFKIKGYQQHEFTYFPFFFWVFTFGVLCSPLMSYDKQRLKRLLYSERLLNYICFAGALLSIPALIDLIPQSTNILRASDLAMTFSDIHNDDDRTANFSFVGGFCFKVLSSAYELFIVCFVPVILSPIRKKSRLVSLMLVVITIVASSLVISSRGPILATIINFVLLYVITIPFLDKNEKRKIALFLSTLVSIPVIIFVAITIARSITYSYYDSDKSLFSFLLSYAGEGFVNFNQYLIHLRNHTNGDYCFFVLKRILGINEVDVVNRQFMYNILEHRLGIPTMRFYTFLGMFVIDIGFINTFLLSAVLSIIIKNAIVSKNNALPLYSLYLLFVYSSVIANGTCIYKYSWNNSTRIILIIFIYYLLKLRIWKFHNTHYYNK